MAPYFRRLTDLRHVLPKSVRFCDSRSSVLPIVYGDNYFKKKTLSEKGGSQLSNYMIALFLLHYLINTLSTFHLFFLLLKLNTKIRMVFCVRAHFITYNLFINDNV